MMNDGTSPRVDMHKSDLHGLHGVEVCMAHIKRLQNRLHFFRTVVEESEAEI